MAKYPEYKKLDLPGINKEVLNWWKEEDTFKKSVETREGEESFVFYEGPPSANGLPGIHHVMARTIKDLFCRVKTQQGYQVKRKAGWDTHGLPVELSVEKELGITKEDIGKSISVEDYNQKCRENVMKYTDVWSKLTEEMGYWVDMDKPYVTYDNKYIESVWWILKQMYSKDMLYKGYTIQPYSPKAGTGLSTHELNQPGCYRDVKDTSAVAMFKVQKDQTSEKLFNNLHGDLFFIAWTTTPWTLPSNCALAVGPKIEYQKVKTFNAYTHQPITVVVAKDLVGKHFPLDIAEKPLSEYNPGDKKIPFELGETFLGSDLVGIHYEQLLDYVQPETGDAFRVIPGDFVTTEDGTGIVHTASVFGADDFKVCQENDVPSILVRDENGELTPLVDKQGRFVKEVTDFAGEYVKQEYYAEGEIDDKYLNVDIKISIKLKEMNRAFKVEKYEHSYPHCWRTDKPILYYPLDSWFVRTTAVKDRLLSNNEKINWKPASTGSGRFGKWLENLVDWNLSRSRYWGIPIPIWTTEDGKEQKAIGSAEELKAEIAIAVQAGFMKENPLADFQPGDMSESNYNTFDFHRPFADEIILVSETGMPMKREADLIDVWFDSGSMPYAQLHYPFENKDLVENPDPAKRYFPADYIAEGVDQTRGWFFTLHAISTIMFDQPAYKNVISNGLVLDKNGNKMSKRLGNAVDPFETLGKYGADATRWYMISNAQPWDNLRFDAAGIEEVQRRFFGTLYNTYNFFALYANIDGFEYAEANIKFDERPEIDRWILSELNTLIERVEGFYNDYEPTRAARAIQHFVTEDLSNWYVRLCRRRFWKGDYGQDKISAYQTLYTCLMDIAKLMAPVAPFFADKLYRDLNAVANTEIEQSVHLSRFPRVNHKDINTELEERMHLAQDISSAVLSIRQREKIKVRQPLKRVMVPVLDQKMARRLASVADLIKSEVNVKDLEIMEDSSILVKEIKPNFRTLGPKVGKKMKLIAAELRGFSQDQIRLAEAEGGVQLVISGDYIRLDMEDLEIITKDLPGWSVNTVNGITVALDVEITEDLLYEGMARELVNRIQNLRKDLGFEVTDKISLKLKEDEKLTEVINTNKNYICAETLAEELIITDQIDSNSIEIAFDDIQTQIAIQKL